MASLALVLALAAPAQRPALAQGVDAQGADTRGGRAQEGDDAPLSASPSGPTAVNKAAAADPPTGEVRPDPDARISAAKLDDKAGAEAPPDAGPPDTGAPAPDAVAAADPPAGAAARSLDKSATDQPSGVSAQLADWVESTADNGDKPFAIVDKVGARIFVFGADGRLRGSAPVLVGLARGDDSAAGIGDRALSAISPDERTTPAGRFVATFGRASGDKTVLWVDYADSISLHPVVTTNPEEHRLRRIKSAAADDHRISYGCINVPARFYDRVVLKAFHSAGGIVYVLPDTRPLDEVFPAFAATIERGDAADHTGEAAPSQVDPALADQVEPTAADRASQQLQGADRMASEATDHPVETQPSEPPAADSP